MCKRTPYHAPLKHTHTSEHPRTSEGTSTSEHALIPKKNFLARSYYDLAQQLLLDGAVPLGLLRSGGPLGYATVVGPGNEALLLQPGDAVYVLAPREWAEHHLGR